MMNRKQPTLFDMGGWRKDEGSRDKPDVVNNGTGNIRRRNSSRRGALSGKSDPGAGVAQVTGTRGKPGRRGGRGRGRGRGNMSRFSDSIITLDDDDDLCQQALGQYELAESDIAQAFSAELNMSEIPGFDPITGDLWIYPTNRPVRDYQFKITETALFNNTLVSLPTGLGKTFIAAVVMYNFHRWYPNHLIVFMAPTKPLVAQQLDACHNIVGINPNVTVELTGQIPPAKRDVLWKEKRVFFLTPQVMQSDISRKVCLPERVRCIVIDEAHKALGNHAYAQVVSSIVSVNKQFRVLALSATPGNDLAAIQQVLKNLLIARVELRTEKSPDVLPYIHDKEVETVVVPLEPFQLSIYDQVKDIYQIYTGKLMQQKILPRNASSFVPFQLLQARERFRASPPSNIGQHERGFVEVHFSVCISLARAMEYLTVHGLRSFYSFLHSLLMREKGSPVVASELRKRGFEALLDKLQQKLNISVENSSFNVSASGLFDNLNQSANTSLLPTNPSADTEDYLQSHPKMRILKEIIEKHFTEYAARQESTRVMIFSQYRDSVQEIGNLLNLLQPRVKPMVFMGQAKTGGGGRGLKQREQIQVVERFKEGGFNVLVATSVGEEGLDIGEVDLIICFDSNKSPTRNIQRMGRTGRQRQGRIIFLLTEGREERLYRSSLTQQSSISRSITDPEKLNPYLFPVSPRMVPADVKPQCYKMNIILSSEQKLDIQKEEQKQGLSGGESGVETLDDSDFLRPAKKKKGRKRAGASSGRKALNSDECVPKGMQSLKKCFENMEIQKPTPTTDTITIDGDEDQNFANSPGDMLFLDADSSRADDYELVCSIFDIQETNASSSVPPCTYVPLQRKSVVWKQEYSCADPKDALLSEGELLCVREIVDSTVYSGMVDRYCKCGNIGSRSPENVLPENDNFYAIEMGSSVPAESSVQLTRSPQKTPLNPVQNKVVPQVISKIDHPFPEKPFVKNPLESRTEPKVSTPKATGESSITNTADTEFLDDLDFGLIMDENDSFFKDDRNGEVERSAPPKTPLEISSRLGNDGTTSTRRPYLVMTPNVKDTSDRDFVPCSDESSTGSECDFIMDDDDTTSKYFRLESKSQQHFANYKPKSQMNPTAIYPSFKIRKPPSCVAQRVNSPPRVNNSPRPDRSAATTLTSHVFPPGDPSTTRTVPNVPIHSSSKLACSQNSTFAPKGSPTKSSDSVLKRSFKFKKVTSLKRPSDTSIMNRTGSDLTNFPEVGTKTAGLVSKTLDVPNVDCIPGTSSEDEDKPVATTRHGGDKVDCDSDETCWDPDEMPPSPPLCRSQCFSQSSASFQNDSRIILASSPPSSTFRHAQLKGRKQHSDFSVQSVFSSRSEEVEGEKSTMEFQGYDNSSKHSKYTFKSPRLLGKSGHGDESQDVKYLGSVQKKLVAGSPGVTFDEFRSPPKKPKFTFSSKSKSSTVAKPTSPVSHLSPIKSPLSSLDSLIMSPVSTASRSALIRTPPAPSRHNVSSSTSLFRSPECDSQDVIVRRKNNVKKRVIRSTERPTQDRKLIRKIPRRPRARNPFLLEEAEGSDDSSDDDRSDFAHSVDSSFVVFGDEEESQLVSASQEQAMYLRSVKDVIPVRMGRIEAPLPPEERLDDATEYLNDSFCDDDVEYADIGVYTQCMIAAREEVDNERRNGGHQGRRLRARR